MKKWNIQKNFSPKDDVLEVLLENRGQTSKKQKEEFLNPPSINSYIQNFSSDFKKSLKVAKDKINKSIKSDQQIIIYGDYDADGICATAILYSTIKNELKHKKTHYFVPNRFKHGYGLSKKGIEQLAKDFPKGGLIITVDTGITGVEEVEIAKEHDFEVIITDHHQKPKKLPKVSVILWNDETVGSGVAWMLSRALGSKNKANLGLVSLATVTDLVPLTGFNRTVVKQGLKILNSNPPIGIKALNSVVGKNDTLTTYDLGWVLGPRLNATGRIDNADLATGLLLSDNYEDALKIAKELNNLNMLRQDKTMEMYELAQEIDDSDLGKIIISAKEEYHEGIIGLVASKLVQKYYRPAIVISLADDVGKGSVRSVKGVNIIELLREFEDLFINLGGHPMAAGFSIETKNVSILEKKLNDFAKKNILDEILVPILDIDMELPSDLLEIELINEISKLEPYGMGNKEPVFCSKNMKLADFKVVGRDQTHVSMQLFDKNKTYKAIFFGGAPLFEAMEIKSGENIDVAYSLNENKFNGSVNLNLIVKDVKRLIDS